MTKLLNIDANPKTIKGQKQGYMTAILYLSPSDSSGYQVCAMAKLAGCISGCLNVAGHGGMSKGNATFTAPNGLQLPDNAIQKARIRRTKLYFEDRTEFFNQLIIEIQKFIKKAGNKGLIPVVRLNGTSDIAWENQKVTFQGFTYSNIFEIFPKIQFYDYAKTYNRVTKKQPNNYHLSLSYSLASLQYSVNVMQAAKVSGKNLIVVVRDLETKRQLLAQSSTYIDGDISDLRFKDAPNSIVLLKAKGKAKKDKSGFVLDYHHAFWTFETRQIAA